MDLKRPPLRPAQVGTGIGPDRVITQEPARNRLRADRDVLDSVYEARRRNRDAAGALALRVWLFSKSERQR
jgi:hypothetical protein